MIKWTQSGIHLSNDTTRAISGIDSATQKKVGLPAFTQLKERNTKLMEAAETERKRKLQHTPVQTPARGETYMTLQQQSVAKVADAGTDKAVIQDILLAQKTMISRLDELTEVSNLMVNAQAGTAVATRLDKHDEALTQMK